MRKRYQIINLANWNEIIGHRQRKTTTKKKLMQIEIEIRGHSRNNRNTKSRLRKGSHERLHSDHLLD